jgi:hypothetical protein
MPWLALMVLFYVGVFSVGGMLFYWKFRLEVGYNGFELASACLRWYLKMMLFDEINGWNYYFPIQWRGYWKVLHAVLMGIEICGVLQAIRKSSSLWEKIRIFSFFWLILLP